MHFLGVDVAGGKDHGDPKDHQDGDNRKKEAGRGFEVVIFFSHTSSLPPTWMEH